MKKTKRLFIVLGISLFLASGLKSCSNEEPCYSCNKKIDAWARANKTVFQDYNREKIITYSGPEQRAIFRTLTPEKRKALWLNKISTVIAATKRTEEKEFLFTFKHFIAKNEFNAHLSGAEFRYLEGLTQKGAERFGWTDEYVIVTFGTLEVVNDRQEYNFFKNTLKDNATVTEDLLDCNCSWGWCPGGDCMKTECEETDFGCGFLFLGSCTKRCGGNPGLDEPGGQ